MAKRGRKSSIRYWRRQGGGYFVTLNGTQHCLALGPDDGPTGPTYQEALEAYKKLLRGEANKGTDGYAVSALFDAYRKKIEGEGRRSMHHNLTHFVKPFCDRHEGLAVVSLKGFHVREWISEAKSWGPSSRRLAVKLLAGMLNWGVKDGLIQSNPLKGRIDLPQD